MEELKTEEVTVLSRKAKHQLLCFDKKYESRIMPYLYKHEEEWVNFGDIHKNCSENILHNNGTSKALNNLKRLGILVNDGKQGRAGSTYKLIKPKYEFLLNLVNQLNAFSQDGSTK